MSLWFELCINGTTLGLVEIQRQQHYDLSDPDRIADRVSDYTVTIDGVKTGDVQHRYGDGAFVLVEKAARLLADRVESVNARPRLQ